MAGAPSIMLVAVGGVNPSQTTAAASGVRRRLQQGQLELTSTLMQNGRRRRNLRLQPDGASSGGWLPEVGPVMATAGEAVQAAGRALQNISTRRTFWPPVILSNRTNPG